MEKWCNLIQNLETYIFTINNEDEIKECWSLNNLFPLWKTTEISLQMGDNIKGSRNVSKTEIYNPLESLE